MVVTAIYCGRRSDSEPQLTGFKDVTSFQVIATLGGSDTSCSEWITVDSQQKIMDMENGLRRAEISCGFQIPCFRNSQWMCTGDDSTKILFQ